MQSTIIDGAESRPIWTEKNKQYSNLQTKSNQTKKRTNISQIKHNETKKRINIWQTSHLLDENLNSSVGPAEVEL